MCSFRIQGNICGACPSVDDVVELAVDSCCCCVRGRVLLLLWVPSSVSEEALVSSNSVKCVLLLLVRLLLAVVVLGSEGGEELLGPSFSLLAQGMDSGDESEQLEGCLNRFSGARGWKPREPSATASK